MRSQIRRLAMFACITAATAFGGHLALADSGVPTQHSEMKGAGHYGKKGERGRHHAMKMAKELGLTEQQKSQAKALWAEHRAANRELFQKMRAERRELRALVHSGSANEGAIRAQAAKVAEAEADLAVSKAQGARKFLALLTPEQVTKYREMMIQHEGEKKRGDCRDKMEGR